MGNHYHLLIKTPLGNLSAFAEVAWANALSHSKEVEKGSLKAWIPINRVIDTVAAGFNQTRKALVYGQRGPAGRNEARWVAMKLGQELSGLTLEALAKAFHVGHYSSISRAISQLNERLTWNKALNEKIKGIYQDLTP